MTDKNAKLKYKHLKNIIAGKYSTERYDAKDLGEETNLNAVSNELLISDATRHLAQLIKVRPNIQFEEAVEKPADPTKFDSHKPIKETKSKEKK